ncbi:MAG: hypothetical protein LUF32_02030 [Clostridiales bacterium]|nr:hypothetical protein [Clostridiales bacterium]
MKNIVNIYVEKFIANHRKTRRVASLLLVLALLVAVGVFWQLHSTGIALTNETYCGLEEHTHSEGCYEEVLVCGLEEDDSHTHDESCYEEQLVCGMEEHTHTIACMSDETADVETADDWEATLPVLTGVWPEDVSEVAESQLGYTESTDNFILDEDGVTCRGYTRYGAWAGNEYGGWDAMFASFCLYYAGVPAETIPESTGAYAWSVKLSEAGLYEDASDDYLPESGDLVFFDHSGDGKVDAVGVITAVSDTGMTVIEGDSNDTVEENIYEIGSAAGYVDISAAYDDYTGNDETGSEAESEGTSGAESEAEAEEESAAETETYTAADGDADITVTAPAGALPEGAELSVTLYDEDSDAYTAAGETVNYDADDEDTGLAAMDISFYLDGEEVEPSETVTVSIDGSALLPDEADASTIEVQHLTETEDGVEAALVADADRGVDTDTVTIEFEVESFSTFTITWSTGNGPQQYSTSITATTYLYGTSSTIGSGSTSLTGTSGTAFDLTSSNSDLDIDGYTLISADVTYNGTTYSDVTAVTVTISRNGNRTTYTYSYTDSTGTTTQLYSGTSSQTVTVSLYYVEEAGITISGTGSDSEGYTLTAATAGSYTYTDPVWSIDDSSLAELIVNDDGTVTVNWTEDATEGNSITVTVTSTYTDYLGETMTVTDTYTLTNGTVAVTIHTTYGTNASTAAGASVALLDAYGNIVASGTTDSNGDVTFNVPAGTYTVEATYYTTTSSGSGGSGGGQSQSSSTGYSYSGSLTVSAETTEITETVNLTADTNSPYDHVDIKVEGTYSLTIETDDGTTNITLTTYAYSGSSFTVTLPDGTVLSGTAEYSDSESEYRLTDQVISSSWDNDDDYGKFSLDVSILVSLSALSEAGLSDSEIESIFGVSLEDGSDDLINYTSETNGVPAGTYIIVEVNGYHPDKNKCEGTEGRNKGYDFEIDLSSALTYLTDQLMVYKYVVDEDGKIIEDDTSFTFTLTKSDDSSVKKTTSLISGQNYTFSDIEAGYYYITESAADGYAPVTLDENGSISDAGYVQYIQSQTKANGTIPTVTFYNLKMETVGAVTLKKTVDEDGAYGTYSEDTFTFLLYTGDDTAGYTLVVDLDEINITADEGTDFYLAEDTYTIVELGSTLAGNDAQTVSINGTTLTRVVAGEDDLYGLDEGTVYYVGTITVTAGSTLTYTATNTYVAGYTMPLTGGIGIWPYTLIGLALCGIAVVLLYRRRRIC